MKRPLMLWCSSHRTLSQEEIPLFLESGFRVIPLLTDFWTLQYDEKLDANLCSDWKQNVELPPDVIKQLQCYLCVWIMAAFHFGEMKLIY